MEERDNRVKATYKKGARYEKRYGIELDTTTKYRGFRGRRRGPVLPGFEEGR